MTAEQFPQYSISHEKAKYDTNFETFYPFIGICDIIALNKGETNMTKRKTPPGNADQLLEELFRNEYSKLMLYAVAELKNEDLAEEAVQDTFHDAVRRKLVLSEHPNPQGWLMQTLKYKIKKRRETLQRHFLFFLPLDMEQIATQEFPAHFNAEIKNVLKDVLDDEEWYFLECISIRSMSHKRLAEELHISVWASRKRLERIRQKIAAVYPEYQKRKIKK